MKCTPLPLVFQMSFWICYMAICISSILRRLWNAPHEHVIVYAMWSKYSSVQSESSINNAILFMKWTDIYIYIPGHNICFCLRKLKPLYFIYWWKRKFTILLLSGAKVFSHRYFDYPPYSMLFWKNTPLRSIIQNFRLLSLWIIFWDVFLHSITLRFIKMFQ